MAPSQIDWPRFWKATTGPHWRQAWAHSSRPLGRDADPLAGQLQLYFRQRERDPSAAAAQFPLIEAAEKLNLVSDVVETLQLLTLALATPQQIAARTGLAAEVISRWQQLYFDMDDFHQATAWHFHIVQRTRLVNPLLACRMRHALGGGLVAVDEMLAAESSMPGDEAGQLWQRKLRLLLKADLALDQLASSRANDLHMVKLYASMRASDLRLDILRQARLVTPSKPLPTAALLSLRWAPDGTAARAAVSAEQPHVVPFQANAGLDSAEHRDQSLLRSA